MNYEFYNFHYITTRSDGAIINAWSDGPHPSKSTEDAICINEEGGYQLRLYIFYPWLDSHIRSEENPPLYDIDGIPLYKWDGSEVVARTQKERDAERAKIPPPPPSPLEQLRADVDYIALIKDVEL